MQSDMNSDSEDAVRRARQQLVCFGGIPRDEIEQTINEVLAENPPYKGAALSCLLVERVVKQWSDGTKCC